MALLYIPFVCFLWFFVAHATDALKHHIVAHNVDVQSFDLPPFSLKYDINTKPSFTSNEEYYRNVGKVTEAFCRYKLMSYFADNSFTNTSEVGFYDFNVKKSSSSNNGMTNVVEFDTTIEFYAAGSASMKALLSIPTVTDVETIVLRLFQEEDSLRDYITYLSFNLVDHENVFAATSGVALVEKSIFTPEKRTEETYVQNVKLPSFSLTYEIKSERSIEKEDYYEHVVEVTEAFCRENLISHFKDILNIGFYDFNINHYTSSPTTPNIIEFDATSKFYVASSLARGAPLPLEIPTSTELESIVVDLFQDERSLLKYNEYLVYNLAEGNPFASTTDIKLLDDEPLAQKKNNSTPIAISEDNKTDDDSNNKVLKTNIMILALIAVGIAALAIALIVHIAATNRRILQAQNEFLEKDDQSSFGTDDTADQAVNADVDADDDAHYYC